ncbi:hypothetical protein GCM10022402_20480 [Salinactinospora qingdaonensis]|uniref:Uncharacterized protein n=1 Tax=Salinactinospora qingdaonensis TaxID=702744 RepID=A0ABP7FIP1_9ACTN
MVRPHSGPGAAFPITAAEPSGVAASPGINAGAGREEVVPESSTQAPATRKKH